MYRGYLGRMIVKNMCALRIQRVTRGFLGRQIVRTIRRKLAAAEDRRYAAENLHVDSMSDVIAQETMQYLTETTKGVAEALAAATVIFAGACGGYCLCLPCPLSSNSLVALSVTATAMSES